MENNESINYNEMCTKSFTHLEENLLSNEKNRYNLLKTFYPQRSSLPVFVTVTYWFGRSNRTVWYWSESEFYLIQPISVLQFSSLFHSNFPHRQRELTLTLSEECASARKEFLETLTARVRKRKGGREGEGRRAEREVGGEMY